MTLKDLGLKLLNQVDPELLGWGFRQAQRIPFLKDRIEQEYANKLAKVASAMRPYRDKVTTFRTLPGEAIAKDDVLAMIRQMSEAENNQWQAGYVSGTVYQGDPEHVAFLNTVYALTSQSNPLHADVWPSATKFESEIVSMTAALLGASSTGDDIGGVVTSGGTESILLAMKAYRDRARAELDIFEPEVIAPVSAHAAFDKAADCFGIKLIRTPVGDDYRAIVSEVKERIGRNTIALIGSAPSFPHGVIDPLAELADLAFQHNVGMHVDACLGGFVLPWAEKLGYPVPPFDFRLPGVTSMSADTHKYGYAAKGTSVVLYRGQSLRHSQYFALTDWPGGLYFSPTLAGSRPGALSACCWAAMVATGEAGYLDATRRILDVAREIKKGIIAIPELELMGDALWVIAFRADDFDIYRLLDAMTARGWSLNGLQRPACLHLCVTLRHAQPGVAKRFLDDLRASVKEVKTSPASKAGMAPIYGLAGSLPLRGAVRELLLRYIDLLYKP